MIKLVFAAVALFLGIAARISLKAKNKKTLASLATVATGIVVAGCLFLSCIQTVPTGHTGVVTTFGKVENTTLDSGVHFVLPWQKVVKMDNRVQKATVTLACFSSDIQEVKTVLDANDSGIEVLLFEELR